jgi:molybdopterin converting factor small subunit
MTPLKKAGQVSKYKDQIFGDLRETYLSDEDLLDIANQIALLRAMQDKFLENLNTARVGFREQDQILKLVEAITRNVERLKRLEQDEALPKAMNTLVQIIVNIANDSIQDEGDRKRFGKALHTVHLPDVRGEAGNKALVEGGKAETVTPKG